MKLTIKAQPKYKIKEAELELKNWNLETRRYINRIVTNAQLGETEDYILFDAMIDVLLRSTTLTEEDIFKLSKSEIEYYSAQIGDEINKKK